MKKYKSAIIFIVVEIGSYFYFHIKNLETFFFAWTFIPLILIFYTIIGNSQTFIRGGNSNIPGMQEENQYTQTYFAEQMGKTVSIKRNKNMKEYISKRITIITYIIFFILNGIGLLLISF